MGVSERLFVDALVDVVALAGDRIALVDHDGATLTYHALLDRARRCASLLRSRGVSPGDLVALRLPKSIDSVVAMLATWMVRAAFVPIDDALPTMRRDALLADAGARAVFSRDDCRLLDVFPPADIEAGIADDLAYIIYTSGSSGAPKGVRVAQRGLLAVLEHQIEHFALGPGKRALFYLSTSFDASISDVGTTLLAGATLFIRDAATMATETDLAAVIARDRITHVDLPPAVLARLARLSSVSSQPETKDHALASLETIVIGGEVCPVEVVRAFAARLRLVNVYGPTEATICTSLVRCDVDWSYPSIGEPIPGIGYQVVDERLAQVADGTPGELLIRGRGLALGYHRRPDLDHAKFIETEVSSSARGNDRAYRTGDRVVRRLDGDYEFLGRIDRQRKLRGQLVEPEEIEACLARHPSVVGCAVVPRLLFGDAPELVAFVIAPEVDETELRAHVLAALPRFMCPARFERVSSLPLSVTGKVDLRALDDVELTERPRFEPPEGARELVLASLFSSLLSIPSVGRHDDFFALGGTSLGVLELVAMSEARGVPLSIDTLYRHATVTALASASLAPSRLDLVTIANDVRRIPFAPASTRAAERSTRRASSDRGEMLVTGATGFLGARVLHRLLERDDGRTFTCLIREGSETGLARLRAAMARQGLAFEEAHARRVRVVTGDLRRRHFGLDSHAFRELGRGTDHVLHLAADVNLVLPYRRLRDTNVLGAAQVATLGALGAAIHHASTLSIFACASPKPIRALEREELDKDSALLGGYAQSKWAAEQVLHGAATTVRFGLLTGDGQTGRASPTCQLATFVRGLARIGAFPEEHLASLAVDVTPIDWAARAFCALAGRDRDASNDDRIFHVASAKGLPFTELVAALRAFGVPLRSVSREEFRAIIATQEMDRTLATTFLGACRRLLDDDERHASSDLFLATDIAFDTTCAARVLSPLGLAPKAIDRALLFRYFEAALGAG